MTPASAVGGRAYAAGRFGLTLEGVPVGPVRSVSGGGISADVIREQAVGHLAEKHIGPPRYEDFAVEVGLGANKALQGWITETLGGKWSRRNGSVESADANLNVKSVREFQNAVISEIGFPALDGSSKEAAYLTLRFTPELTRTTKGSGKLSAPSGAKQKKWLASNFRFELGDLPTKRVSKIDAFAIRQRVATDQFGEIRERRKQPVVIEVPDLKITFAEVDLPKWQEWFEDFVIKGNSGQENEKSGAIAFLDAALAKELGSIELQNVGIYRLAPEPATAGAEAVRRWTAELYVERMAITLS
jgi:hypothetical protein